VNVHPEPPVPAWSTVIVCRATVAVPVRLAASGFGATTTITLPGPFPVGPVASASGSTVIHGTFPAYVHVQFAPVVTRTSVLPPAAAMGVPAGTTA